MFSHVNTYIINFFNVYKNKKINLRNKFKNIEAKRRKGKFKKNAPI